jgi:hypothetical protein
MKGSKAESVQTVLIDLVWSGGQLIGPPLAIMSLADAEDTDLAIPETTGSRT